MKNRRLAVVAGVLWSVALIVIGARFAASGPIPGTTTYTVNEPTEYNQDSSFSGAAEICHIISGYSTVPLDVYGVHVANTDSSARYLAIFPDRTTKPNNGTVIPGGGWWVDTLKDFDMNTVAGGIPSWLKTTHGLTVCLSTTQGTFTATTAVGWFWVLYKGFVTATPTPTPTPT